MTDKPEVPEIDLFAQQMRGVTPIRHDRADTGKPKADRQQLKRLRENATIRSNQTKVDGLSDQFVIDVGGDLFFRLQ